MYNALRKDGDTDYSLIENSCWITVGNVSVYVKKDEEGVTVETYGAGCESTQPLTISHVFWEEADEAQRECGREAARNNKSEG